jgi:hypothetical protein
VTISSTAITVTITVKGYAAADGPMAGFDKAGLAKEITDWIHARFPTRTPHLGSVSNAENQYLDTNEVHAATSAITNNPAGTLGAQDKAAGPAGDITTAQAEPVTVSISLA